MQILADVMGCPVRVVAAPGDAAARGAALLVGKQLGWTTTDSSAEFFPVAAEYLPEAGSHRRYSQLQAIFGDLYGQLKGTFAQLAAVH